MANYFEKIEGANIETNAQMAMETVKTNVLDSNEGIIFPDMIKAVHKRPALRSN